MIEVNIKYILEKLGDHFTNDIDKNRKSLYDVVYMSTDLAQTLNDAKVKVDTWEYHFEVLIEKIIHTSLSVLKLSEGIKFNTYKNKRLNIPMVDGSSMLILSRSIIECYLTLYYIFITKQMKEERFFRYKLWQISGIIVRQKASTHNSEELKQKQIQEKMLIEQLKTEIQSDPKYKKLKKKHLYKLNTYGLPRIDSWTTLIESSDLDSKYFKDIYSLTSNYAHSEYLSTLQLQQSTRNIDDSSNLDRIGVSFSIIRMINVLIVDWLRSEFKCVNLVFKTMPLEFQNVVHIWSQVARGKKNKQKWI